MERITYQTNEQLPHMDAAAQTAGHRKTDDRYMGRLTAIKEVIKSKPTRSAWDRGVKSYAAELLDDLADNIQDGYIDPGDLDSPALLRRAMLDGAADWGRYSWGGCSLIYDADIAERLCTPSEYKRKRGGYLRPNSREAWLDVQARALAQAARWIINAARA